MPLWQLQKMKWKKERTLGAAEYNRQDWQAEVNDLQYNNNF